MQDVTEKAKRLSFFITLGLVCSTAPLLHAGETLRILEREIQTLIDSSKQSVVTVTARFSTVVSSEKETGLLSFFKSENPTPRSRAHINVGSGIIFDRQGYILTRSSIVLGAEADFVTLADGRELNAQFVGHDPETGLAILKVDSAGLKPARFGNSDRVVPGSWALLIGNSVGVYPSIVLSAVNGIRNDGLIQISASLSPGNNGSALISAEGEVIGVVAGRIDPRVGFDQTISIYDLNATTLAYPINWIKKIARDIIEYGHVRKGWLGVVGYYDGRKPKIRAIKENSPAEKAGLTKGDVILKFSNKEVKNISELARMVEYTVPGQEVSLEYMRGGEVRRVDVEIGQKAAPDVTLGASAGSGPQAFLPQTQEVNTPGHDLNPREKDLLEKRINRLEWELRQLKKLVGAY
ncbi:MAG: PDZ domain-containing protein [Calditrichaeota bacterium]|nr:MAG: PDZ domain-containing protein [Calditrichota bacterium]